MVDEHRAVYRTGVPHVWLSASQVKSGFFLRDVDLFVPVGNVVLSLWWGSLGVEELYQSRHPADIGELLFQQVVLNPRVTRWQMNYYFMAEAIVAYENADRSVAINSPMLVRPPRDDELGRARLVAAEFAKQCERHRDVTCHAVDHGYQLANPPIVPLVIY